MNTIIQDNNHAPDPNDPLKPLADNPMRDMNDQEIDVLREIANIGAGHAATALAEMLSHRIDMDVPLLRVLQIEELFTFFGDPEKEVAGIVFELEGEVRGNVLYIIEKQLVHMLLNALLNKNLDSFEEIDEMDCSVMTEIGNIVVGSYITAMSETTGLDIRITPPNLSVDMIGAILNYPLQFFGTLGDQVLFIEDAFTNGDKRIICHLLIMPEPDTLQTMMHKLGIEHGK